MRNFFLILSFLLHSLFVSAQGNLQEEIFSQELNVIEEPNIEQILDKEKIEFDFEEIVVFNFSNTIKETSIQYRKDTVDEKKPNYHGSIELGYNFGLSKNRINNFRLNIISGWPINFRFSMGLRRWSKSLLCWGSNRNGITCFCKL